eukprot:scaffold1237_cov67-Phaeocystis_antarctica.AAC.4
MVPDVFPDSADIGHTTEVPLGQERPFGQAAGVTVASVPHVKPAGQSPAHAALVCWLVSDPLPPSTPAAQAKGRRAVVNVVGGTRLAACGGILAGGVASVTRLAPDLAPGRGHPVARWRGQHVGGGAARIEVEILAFCGVVVHEAGRCHRECASINVDTSTLPTMPHA